MADATIHFIHTAAAVDAPAEATLSPLAKTCVITGLALAAWIPVLVPFFLIFHH
jgi:hypothetical protein